ncbi:MAG TPA: M14 family zinc carboxypeptidase [Pyrinomonadaceae bacterium]|nr:M14 family zinc carboxypeptidase [Pyrinomonadaceae bacterium]
MYRTVAALNSAMSILADFFPDVCTRVEMPHRSNLGDRIFALRMRAGTSTSRRGVLLVGGMHARELMNPDAIVDLSIDLVLAYLNETGITYGGQSWTVTQIKIMLEALDIWFLPCANPDGREYVLTADDLWRKNRRDNPDTTCEGVDVNRNCDIVWGVTTSNTSCHKCDGTYLGSDRFSEPEALNIKALCDEQRIDVFLDVHSYSELVLFPWGHARTQTTDPSQRFTDLATDTCLPLSPAGHQEFMLPRDQLRFQRVANKIVADIRAVRGRSYRPEPIFDLYATTGTSSDYVYSRHIADPALRKTYGFGFETGPPVFNSDGSVNLRESFHPTDATAESDIKRDTKAGMISLLQQSICAIEFIGATISAPARGLQKIREVRDERLATTGAGRDLIALFERVQIPLLGLVLADKALTKEAMSLLDTSLKLLEDDKAIVPASEVERGLKFVDALTARTKSKSLRRDLETVRKRLKSAGNKKVGKILKELLSTSAGKKS